MDKGVPFDSKIIPLATLPYDKVLAELTRLKRTDEEKTKDLTLIFRELSEKTLEISAIASDVTELMAKLPTKAATDSFGKVLSTFKKIRATSEIFLNDAKKTNEPTVILVAWRDVLNFTKESLISLKNEFEETIAP